MEIETIYKLLNTKSAEDCRLGLYFLDRLDKESFNKFVEKYNTPHDHANTDYSIRLEECRRPALKRIYFRGHNYYYLFYDDGELMIDTFTTGKYLLSKYPHIYTVEEL